MTHHQDASPAPVGGSLINAATLVCGVLITIMAAILLVRFVFGLGAVIDAMEAAGQQNDLLHRPGQL